MTSDVASQILRRPKICILPLLCGILALSAEATIMTALMVMVAICTFGSIIWWLIAKGNPSRRTAPQRVAVPPGAEDDRAKQGAVDIIGDTYECVARQIEQRLLGSRKAPGGLMTNDEAVALEANHLGSWRSTLPVYLTSSGDQEECLRTCRNGSTTHDAPNRVGRVNAYSEPVFAPRLTKWF